MTNEDVNQLIEAAERAAIAAMRLGFGDGDARKIVRVEIHPETRDALFRWADELSRGPLAASEAMCGLTPLRVRGISYYVINNQRFAWRIVGVSQATTGRLGVSELEYGAM